MSVSTLQSPELAPSLPETPVATMPEQMISTEEYTRILQPVERPTATDGWEFHGQNAERVNQAIEDAPFIPNAELIRGIETYYGQHRQLGSTIDSLLDNEPPSDEAERAQDQGLLEQVVASSTFNRHYREYYSKPNHYFSSHDFTVQAATAALASMRLARLKNPDDLALKSAELRLIKTASEVVYAEASVGVTTIGEAELVEVTDRQNKIKQRFADSDLFTQYDSSSDTFYLKNEKFPGTISSSVDYWADPAANVGRAIKKFWADTRFAGQLLFHGSTSFDDMYRTSMLTTRRVQEYFWGSYNTRNVQQFGSRLHSPVPHFSEHYHEVNYRGRQGDDNSGTLAIPLVEVIKYAPIARDSEYATLQLKPGMEEAIIPQVTVIDTIQHSGSGTTDTQGEYGSDRSFYRSVHDADPSAPLSEAPDGYAFPLNETVMRIALGEEADKSDLYGYGQHMPIHVEIPVVNPKASYERLPDAVLQERQKTIADTIRKLQHDSIRKYGEQIVVPIRSGVMEYYVEDSGVLMGRQPAHFAERTVR